MSNSGDEDLHLAIVGAGPTGLSAMESLLRKLAASPRALVPRIVLFDPNPHIGSGPNFAPDQTDANVLNIAERLLQLEARPLIELHGQKFEGFPGYAEWASLESEWETDSFPPRSKLGAYLGARALSLVAPLAGLSWLSVVPNAVVRLSWSDHSAFAHTAEETYGPFSELALAAGHTPTSDDEALISWRNHARTADVTLVTEPYPTHRNLDEKIVTSQDNVAIRGLGLAMIDVAKSLTEDRGGQFMSVEGDAGTLRYESSGREPKRIVPFSLDGLPPAPKPVGAFMDARYTPTTRELDAFASFLVSLGTEGRESSTSRNSVDKLIDHIATLHAHRFAALGERVRPHTCDADELTEIGRQWLKDGDDTHAVILDAAQPPEVVLREFANMALGSVPASFDYSLGQLWRHLQPKMYEHLSYVDWPEEELIALTKLDEKIKRYAFGPPVRSALCLLALVDANLLTFRLVEDPDIRLVPEGWQLDVEDDSLTANVMIDSVLDSPNLEEMTAPLIQQLKTSDKLRPIADGMGARTRRDGVSNSGESDSANLAVLGRIAKGTLLGTDAILEVFGPRQDAWADGVVRRASRSRESMRENAS